MCDGGFPGGSVVKKKNQPANAGDGFDPGSGKIPYAAELLSLDSEAWEPQLLSPHAATFQY